MPFKKLNIFSFDKTTKEQVLLSRPEKYNQLFNIINSNTVIARGAGLSYCAASFGENSVSISSEKFNRILEFNEQTGLIRIETGATLASLLRFSIKRNWFLPVIPGYPEITIGGCIAFNVHGKSQTKFGLFGDYVKSIHLYHPDYGEIECSPSKNSDIFKLTINGFGLTGYIIDATIQLIPLTGNILIQSKIECKNLIEAVEKLKDYNSDFDYAYSWNNLNRSGNSFGKGFVYLEKLQAGGEFHDFNFNPAGINKRNLLGLSLLNILTVGIMCTVYELANFLTPDIKNVNLLKGSFPIYGKEIYFKLFGNKGFREYQTVVPYSKWEAYLKKIENVIRKYNQPISLGSLKLLKGEQEYLNFCQDGVCIAIDVPNDSNSILFFRELDIISVEFGAICNISKDSRLSASVIQSIYSHYNEYKRDLNQFDPAKRFNSLLRKRLEV